MIASSICVPVHCASSYCHCDTCKRVFLFKTHTTMTFWMIVLLEWLNWSCTRTLAILTVVFSKRKCNKIACKLYDFNAFDLSMCHFYSKAIMIVESQLWESISLNDNFSTIRFVCFALCHFPSNPLIRVIGKCVCEFNFVSHLKALPFPFNSSVFMRMVLIRFSSNRCKYKLRWEYFDIWRNVFHHFKLRDKKNI